MSTHSAPRAAARAAIRSGAPRSTASPARRRPDSSDRLRRLSDRLDRLQSDVSIGARSQREFERQVEEAESIAAGLRAVFREKDPPEAVHPPLRHDGSKAWW